MFDPSHKQLIGIVWMVAHSLLATIVSVMVRHLAADFHMAQILFFYNISSFLFLILWVVGASQKLVVKTTRIKLFVVRAILGVTGLASYFYAFTVMPMTDARAIALTGPLATSIAAVIFLKEKMGWRRAVALLLGFLGAIVIIRPGTVEFSYYSLLVVGSVLIWVAVDMIIKILGRTEATLTQLFYLLLFMSIFSLPAAIFYWKTPETLSQWLWLFGVGFIFLLNVACMFNAYKNADIVVLMPFDFTGMVFMIMIAYGVFGEIIDHWTLIGSVVIVSASAYVVHREARRAKLIHATPSEAEIV